VSTAAGSVAGPICYCVVLIIGARLTSFRSTFPASDGALTLRLLALGADPGYLSAVSLSTFVERKDVKEYLRLNVVKPWFQMRAEIKAPPLTTSYGWTGTAFDYAMRFYLQKLNPSAKVSRWLAEDSAALGVASRHETARTKKRVLGIIETAKESVARTSRAGATQSLARS
jgi:hypothetical protein